MDNTQHIQLIRWAVKCTENVLPLTGRVTAVKLKNILVIAEEWAKGTAKTGDARKASLKAISIARESPDPVAVSVARSAGHAVATAHMADHCIGAALYAVKAAKAAGRSSKDERNWQNGILPREIKELVLDLRCKKEKHFRIPEQSNS